MPIGKDSIQKRVAKTTEAAPAMEVAAVSTAAETVAETVAETAAAEVKPAAKKKAAPKTAAPKANGETAPKTAPKKRAPAKKPATTILSNVAPETVEAVVGHKENAKVEHVQIGSKMPDYLL